MTTAARLTLSAVLLAATLGLPACAGPRSSERAAAPTPAGPAPMAAPAATRDPAPSDRHAEAEARLRQMEQAMAASSTPAQIPSPQHSTPPQPEPVAGAARTDYWQPVTIDQGAQAPPTAAPRVVAETAAGREPEPEPMDPAERRRALVDELAGSLQRDGIDEGYLLPAWIRIAALEAVEPGALNAHFFPNTPGGPASDLTAPEHELLTAWRDLHVAVYEHADSADVETLARVIGEHAEKLQALQPLEIVDARLCTRVQRFGVFDERDATADGVYKLVAGKPQRLLVYLELDHYEHTPDHKDGVEGHTVDLTFSLALHHLGRDTDLLAWRMADEKVSVFSRNKRREFFVSVLADLPPTISIDRYNLKARVTDETSGEVAETILRIDMVGDASALSSATD